MLNRTVLLNSDANATYTASQLVAADEALDAEAREAIPFTFDACSYDAGYVDQSLWACQTCPGTPGLCSACAIVCHGQHELVELFVKRHFRCDCGTNRIQPKTRDDGDDDSDDDEPEVTLKCALSMRQGAPLNTDNKYDDNFRNMFCVCKKPYDPESEDQSMYECVACQDWFHTGCLAPNGQSDLLPEDSFEGLLCPRCVKDNASLRELLSMYVDYPRTKATIIDKDLPARPSFVSIPVPAQDDVDMKEAGSCTAPGRAVPMAERPLSKVLAKQDCPVYLDDGFPTSWCTCPECSPLLLTDCPYLTKDPEDNSDVWQPPEDADARYSSFELGMAALDKLPRAQALDAILAYQGFSGRLRQHLKPFAGRRETVTKETIDQFLEAEKERRSKVLADLADYKHGRGL